MKKLSLFLILSFLAFSGAAQSEVYQKVRRIIETNYPEVQTENRLIAINFWSVNDATSRELNKQFNKNYNTYKFARLRGGKHGLIGVAICIDENNSQATIVLNKDGAGDLIQIGFSELGLAEKPFNNAVFDSAGNKVYSDLQAQEVFTKINQLLTR